MPRIWTKLGGHSSYKPPGASYTAQGPLKNQNSSKANFYLERAAREHRRPLAGMFRVRGVPGKCSSFVQHGCLLGLFGNSWGFLWDADGTSVCCRLFFWHLLTISKTLGRTSHASLIAQGALAEAWGINISSASFRTFGQVRRRGCWGM